MTSVAIVHRPYIRYSVQQGLSVFLAQNFTKTFECVEHISTSIMHTISRSHFFKIKPKPTTNKLNFPRKKNLSKGSPIAFYRLFLLLVSFVFFSIMNIIELILREPRKKMRIFKSNAHLERVTSLN